MSAQEMPASASSSTSLSVITGIFEAILGVAAALALALLLFPTKQFVSISNYLQNLTAFAGAVVFCYLYLRHEGGPGLLWAAGAFAVGGLANIAWYAAVFFGVGSMTFPGLFAMGFVAAILLLSTWAAATSWYVSPLGDDSRTSAQAQDPATPWKTLAKAATGNASRQSEAMVRCRRVVRGDARWHDLPSDSQGQPEVTTAEPNDQDAAADFHGAKALTTKAWHLTDRMVTSSLGATLMRKKLILGFESAASAFPVACCE